MGRTRLACPSWWSFVDNSVMSTLVLFSKFHNNCRQNIILTLLESYIFKNWFSWTKGISDQTRIANLVNLNICTICNSFKQWQAVQCRHISIDVSHVFRDTCVCKRRNSCRRNPLLMACYTQQNSRRALLHYCFWQILHKCQIAGSACKAICSNSCVCMCAICTCRIFIHFIFPRCLLFLMLHYACADAQLR